MIMDNFDDIIHSGTQWSVHHHESFGPQMPLNLTPTKKLVKILKLLSPKLAQSVLRSFDLFFFCFRRFSRLSRRGNFYGRPRNCAGRCSFFVTRYQLF